MQIQYPTPAESLLHRLLHSKKLMTYQLSIEKEESFTNILISLARTEPEEQAYLKKRDR